MLLTDGMGAIRVGAAQISTAENLAENRDRVEQMVLEAAADGCRIVLFHEGCLTGYPDAAQVEDLDFRLVEEAEASIQALARERGISVLLGSTSRSGDAIHNDLLILSGEGRVVGRHAKTWRAGEPWYHQGTGPVIFEVCGVLATAIICHDLRYPELVRLPVAAGAQIVFISNNESGLLREDKLAGYRAMQIARATENYVYAVMANAPADSSALGRRASSHGNSMIVDPLGNVLVEAGYFEERLVTATLDLDLADRSVVLRSLGKDPQSHERYGPEPEHPDYRNWLEEGIRLVRRLDG
jgi:predicted amidohydrolase